MNKEKSWREIVKRADAYLALDQISHYLYCDRVNDVGDDANIDDYPWEFVTSCTPGGSHRLEISTSVRFEAEHPTGLRFSWSYDIEPYSANGAGYYVIDVKGCQRILKFLNPKARKDFTKYLKDCAAAVANKADEWAKLAEKQRTTAAELIAASQAK